ncbi:hypothetical protein [Streptomyces sp. SAJ15]|uniref:hypothetical protein n=1 Tax=Streptomyces sp. SAJ15 TaxID=2011095 RepID=UPI00135F0BCA|nr:hypothetical protein [Streptomyces sp. SAJ15]TVL89717.1 hypothetical protein CD790_25275 [Streptomyces sp. SAJ15]
MYQEPELLRPREEGMLIMRARGFTIAEISREYGLGPDRTRQVIKAACKALGATEPIHALAIALTVGLFTVDDLSGESDSLGEMKIPQHVREAMSGVSRGSHP